MVNKIENRKQSFQNPKTRKRYVGKAGWESSQQRVQQVGPEKFGIVSQWTCAKKRSKMVPV